MKSRILRAGLLIASFPASLFLTAQRVGIETQTPDSTLSISNKVEIGGTEGDIVLTDDLASITFPATEAPNSPMMHMFSGGFNNDDRMVFAHSPDYTDYGLQYRDVGDQFRFIGNGYHAFSISLEQNQGKAALGDAEIHDDYTFNVETNSENRVLNIYNYTNTTSVTHGIHARNNGSGSGPKRGGLFGVAGGSGQNIGMMATASGSSDENIAVYGFAIGANAKAAHFDAGDVVIDDQLIIGTDVGAAGYKLSVDGKIISEELRIQDVADWPDYVFADGYKLMPLDELEERIARERHLPGIPSAAVVESDGLDAGQMHKLQMQKIEELTLYIIDLHKSNKALKTEITKLNNELTVLKTQ